MMAVGACDAYFSDAYADLISRTLRAKELVSMDAKRLALASVGFAG